MHRIGTQQSVFSVFLNESIQIEGAKPVYFLLKKFPGQMNHELAPLFRDIGSHLQDDANRHDRFTALIDDFQNKTSNKAAIFTDLLNLVSDNPILVTALHQASLYFAPFDLPIRAVSELLGSLPSDEMPRFTHIAALFAQGWISLDLCSLLIDRFAGGVLPDEIRALRTCMGPAGGAFRMPTTVKFVADSPSALVAVQLLAVLGLWPDVTVVESALRCLNLFAFALLPLPIARDWLTSLDPILGQDFTEISDPPFFFPMRVRDTLIAAISEPQTRWLLSDQLFHIIGNLPKIETDNSIQNLNVQSLKDPCFRTVSERSIANLQSVTWFNAFRSASRAIRAGEALLPAIDPTTIDAIFPSNGSLLKSDQFWRVFFEEATKRGRRATEQVLRGFEDELTSLDPSSETGRMLYSAKIKPSFLLREVFFLGRRHALGRPSEIALNILERAFAVFEITQSKFVKEAFQKGKIDCDESVALLFAYVIELIRLVEGVEEAKFQELLRIPRRFFDEDLPLTGFEGEAIANADLVIVQIAKRLKRLLEGGSYDFDGLPFTGAFVFHIEFGEEIMISTGTMNFHNP
jgi:hypothetical protein